MTVSDVVGIDAHGQRVAGSMRVLHVDSIAGEHDVELSSTTPASSRDAKKLGSWKAVSRKP